MAGPPGRPYCKRASLEPILRHAPAMMRSVRTLPFLIVAAVCACSRRAETSGHAENTLGNDAAADVAAESQRTCSKACGGSLCFDGLLITMECAAGQCISVSANTGCGRPPPPDAATSEPPGTDAGADTVELDGPDDSTAG